MVPASMAWRIQGITSANPPGWGWSARKVMLEGAPRRNGPLGSDLPWEDGPRQVDHRLAGHSIPGDRPPLAQTRITALPSGTGGGGIMAPGYGVTSSAS